MLIWLLFRNFVSKNVSTILENDYCEAMGILLSPGFLVFDPLRPHFFDFRNGFYEVFSEETAQRRGQFTIPIILHFISTAQRCDAKKGRLGTACLYMKSPRWITTGGLAVYFVTGSTSPKTMSRRSYNSAILALVLIAAEFSPMIMADVCPGISIINAKANNNDNPFFNITYSSFKVVKMLAGLPGALLFYHSRVLGRNYKIFQKITFCPVILYTQ